MKKKTYIPVIVSALLGGLVLTSCGKDPQTHDKEDDAVLVSIELQNVVTTLPYGSELFKPTVIAHYSDGFSKEVTATFTGFDGTKKGKQTVNVSYTEGDKTVTTSFEVTVKSDSVILSSISISQSTKINYKYGESFENPVVIAHYDDGSTADVSAKVNIEHSFNGDLSGSYPVTITYEENGVTVETTYTAVVDAPTLIIQKIEFVGEKQTEYSVGDTLVKPTVVATFSDSSTQDVTNKVVFDYDFSTPGTKEVTAKYTYDTLTLTIKYTVTVTAVSSKVKFAIFADVQLCNDVEKDGAASNLGETANAPLALEQHLKYIKSQDINVVLMNGDVTNQANENYYNYFESIVTKVYGSDKSIWPEFVWNMGNHEWWAGTTEKDPRVESSGSYTLPDGAINAVGLFNEHARIESDNLVKRSSVKYASNVNDTLPTYYKVINGVPFLTISGMSSSGNITTALKSEISSWLIEIKQLESVKAGGPIFVQYHYPLETSMTHGQGSSELNTQSIDELFANTPNAIIFTGDTHFPGNNERSINQSKYTTINLGTSSYSRMVDQSAVICDDYENVTGGHKEPGKGEIAQGNAGYLNAYTPNIQIIEVMANNATNIDRMMTNEDGTARKVGEKWIIPAIKSTDDFTYTNARFQNKNAAKALYGQEGVSWEIGDKVEFGVNKDSHQMTVHFTDPIEHNFTEHYVITVNGVAHDFVSNYYKYPANRQQNYYVIENLPDAENYNVEVTAYDFFDNPSLNKLTASTNDDSKAIEPLDLYFVDGNYNYSDIETRNNFEDVAEGSNSSNEFFYRGIQTYKYGATLGRLLYTTQNYKVGDYLSLKNGAGSNPTVTMDVKNLELDDLVLGLTVVDKTGKWLTDFGAEYQKTVSGNGWTTLTWNLKELFNISSKEDLQQIGVKAKSTGATTNGYTMHLLVDNIDLTDGGSTPTPVEDRGLAFKAGEDLVIPLNKQVQLNDKLSVDFKLDSSNTTGKVSISLLDNADWGKYFGYYSFFSNGSAEGEPLEGVSVSKLDDGYFRVTFELSKLIPGHAEGGLPTTFVDTVYIRGGWTSIDGRIDVNPSTDIDVVRGEEFKAGSDLTLRLDKQVNIDESLSIDLKLDQSNTTGKVAISLLDFNCPGWANYFGYYSFFSNGTVEGGPINGVSISNLSDGYFRVTFDLSKLTLKHAAGLPTDFINTVYIRGGWTSIDGRIDINPPSDVNPLRGEQFKASTDWSKTIDDVNISTGTIIIDFKFTSASDTYVSIMLGNGWNDYFGYYKIFANGTLNKEYPGVTIADNGDGYYRVPFTLNQLNEKNGTSPNPSPDSSINLLYMRGIWCTASGYIDINPSL